MKPVWTWGGEFFGYISGQGLFTHVGREVGRFNGDDIYGTDGRYIGELKSENRLITNRAKTSWVRSAFAPRAGMSIVQYVNYVGYVMYVGFDDFPSPGAF